LMDMSSGLLLDEAANINALHSQAAPVPGS
jgi:hypothetical protein